MRVNDLPMPVIGLDEVESLAGWPVRPVIAIEGTTTDELWDELPEPELWDDGNVWDDVWRDATCSWTGMEIDLGEPDEAGLFPSARCVVQLDNADGSWSTLNPDGTVSAYGPGTRLMVWAHRDIRETARKFGDLNFGDETFGGEPFGDWWLFSGHVSRYDQRVDDTVEIEAFDAFSDLAQPIGTFTPGANGNKPGARLTAILSAAGELDMPHRFDVGVVALTAQETEASPLEEMQAVALSDGGVVFVDADGTLVFSDRLWPAGRDDQVDVPVTSANVCSTPFIVWDAVVSTNDESLADKVVLENKAKLKSTAGATPGYTLAFNDLQYTTQAEGDILAQYLLAQQQPRRLSIEEFSLYLNDPNQPDIWRAVDWRRLDHLRFLHDQKVVGGTLSRVDVTTVLDSIIHQITPEGWTMVVSTAKVRAFTEPIFYDDGALYDTGEGYGY